MFYGLFGGQNFNPDKDIPDLSGKVFFVTGGNAGLGKETITQLAKHNPAHIYLGARSAAKAAEAIASIEATVPQARITHIPLDLASFQSVHAAADLFTALSSRLDVLINNAGIMATPPGETKDGYEIQFGTNHMGHALLIKLLLPILQSTAARYEDVRIVNLTSTAHNITRNGLLLDKTAMESAGTWTRYGNSKLANILYSRSLSQKFPDISTVSVHPGLIHTDLYGPSSNTSFALRSFIALIKPVMYKDVHSGAHNQLWAATCPRTHLQNGAFYDVTAASNKGSKHARSQAQADSLWDFTARELAEKGFS